MYNTYETLYDPVSTPMKPFIVFLTAEVFRTRLHIEFGSSPADDRLGFFQGV